MMVRVISNYIDDNNTYNDNNSGKTRTTLVAILITIMMLIVTKIRIITIMTILPPDIHFHESNKKRCQLNKASIPNDAKIFLRNVEKLSKYNDN